ncbi:MAG: energy transducer TonB [Melioribacteraceae bacterium]|jgi:protein TonB|nr:energy transducer TonB [Melioribacteraceae bacterium]
MKRKFLILALMICTFTFNQINASALFSGEDEYILAMEKPAAPVDGLQGIYQKITYPKIAISSKVEGKVYVLVLVNEKGDVDDAKIVKGIGAGCDEEAVKAIKKTKFSPGIHNGQPTKSKLSLAVQFKLS